MQRPETSLSCKLQPCPCKTALKAEPTDVAAEGASRNDDNAASVPAEPVNVPSSSTPPDDDVRTQQDKSPEESSAYGPVRRRLRGKNGDAGNC